MAVGYLERLRAGVAPVQPTELDEVLSFRRAAWGEGSVRAAPDDVRWAYLDDGAPGRLWAWRREGRIEAMQGGLSTVLRVGTSELTAVWCVELMVSERYRARGVGAVLGEVALQGAEVGLGLEIAPEARAGFLRSGWTDLGAVPLWVYPSDPRRLAEARGLDLPRPVALAASLALRALRGVHLGQAAMAGLRLESAACFDERADAIWQRCARHYPVLTCRDRAFLSWRFDRFPEPARYQRHWLVRRGRPVGYAVLRVGEHHGLRSGHLVDFLCEPRWTAGLLALSLERLGREEVAAVYCLHRNPVSEVPFRRMGFLRRTSGWSQVVRGGPAVSRDARSWFLTAADSNVDRARDEE